MSAPRKTATPSPWPAKRIHGQESFLLRTSTVELAITSLGGMLGPVTFFPQDDQPIEPYHIAPWAEEPMPPDTPPMLQALRGDWFCSAFGENAQPYQGHHLPPHGETANGTWRYIGGAQTEQGARLRLGIDLPLQGGHCKATTVLLNGHSVIYQRHDFTGFTSAINPGHHATLQFPDSEGAGRLSFSRVTHARTYFHAIDGPRSQHYSRLQPNCEIRDLSAVPCGDGTITDVTRFPARRGFDDIVILCADPKLDFAWSAVTFPEQRYVWFALRDPKQLASTLLWFSNGGRKSPPWNGRHTNVMGIEDITAFFHVGIAESCRPNALTACGVRTCLEPDPQRRLSIPYIQGVTRIPQGFDRVAKIELGQTGRVVLTSDSELRVDVPCDLDFLRTGTPIGLDFP